MENLYRVGKNDLPKAGAVLADAFQHDPIWKNVFEGVGVEQRQAFFQSPACYCLKYGTVFAPSENLEGIAAWAPSDYADITFWRAIRSGSSTTMMKMGMKTGMRIMTMMKTVFAPLEKDRKANMKGRPHIYLMIIGVALENQGQGFGKKLLEGLLEESEQAGVPVYLETSTERNVRMYEKLGFKMLTRIVLPVINLPQWEMIREV